MFSSKRMVIQSPVYQGETEAIAYSVDLSNWAGTASAPSAKVWQGTTGSWLDMTATIMPSGSCSINGSFLTLPPVKNVQETKAYHIIATFTINSNTESFWFDVVGEK